MSKKCTVPPSQPDDESFKNQSLQVNLGSSVYHINKIILNFVQANFNFGLRVQSLFISFTCLSWSSLVSFWVKASWPQSAHFRFLPDTRNCPPPNPAAAQSYKCWHFVLVRPDLECETGHIWVKWFDALALQSGMRHITSLSLSRSPGEIGPVGWTKNFKPTWFETVSIFLAWQFSEIWPVSISSSSVIKLLWMDGLI